MKMNNLLKIAIVQEDEYSHIWNVAVADNTIDRCTGLSEVKKLKKNSGMLFKFSAPELPTITTFPMKFPIDIICFNNELIINDIFYNVPQGQLVNIRKPILFFLEINSGESKKVHIGDKLVFI